ncbi:ABC transporter ATP-binding protein [Limnohabitans sp. Jir72]|uniref:ABC transporter ATP-binding protein n=1 Tax=Limnohabitans sp. Jir72 TaxID=1977909 RepID=UPI000D360892|nr:ABC transporter ATP-binding protein [Limnohabitans sp. Jir72]PUE26482.1 branched-chain amino acid ABC transporter ATP-binding protein [Limnohabitans sp. Jir72]
MLHIDQIQVNYGAAPALWDVSLQINAGELVSVIGPNGAGKTTLIQAIMGMNALKQGKIEWEGETISALPAHRLCEKGLALVPESRRLFTGMTVRENLELGAMHPAARAVRARTFEQVCDLFPAVRAKLGQVSGTLSGGQQQMVAIGRAMMALPRLLLLDEPSLGLAPSIVGEMFRAIEAIHQSGTAVMLVEQNVSRALAISQRTYVLENGRVVTSGVSSELSRRDEIRKAYLGV